jgi:hypothetical protein
MTIMAFLGYMLFTLAALAGFVTLFILAWNGY